MSDTRNTTAAVCRAQPNGLNNLATKIDQCTTSTELIRNQDLASKVFGIQQDMDTLRASVMDSLVMGDAMFGRTGHGDMTSQALARNEELSLKKEQLSKDITKKEALVERSNRDFEDVKDTIAETQTKRVLHFIEDYTIVILLFSYLFMILSGIYVYVILSDKPLRGLLEGIVGSVVLSAFLFMILLYLL